MKHLYLLLCGLLAALPLFSQTTGGPDSYGYVWKNQANPDPDAPVYNWIDIDAIGTVIPGLGDDNSVGPFSIGFPFRYYWSDYSQVWIGSNGYIGFQPVNISSLAGIAFPTLPTNDPNNNVVAPMLSDLTLASPNPNIPNPGSVIMWTNNLDSCVITYKQVPFWNNIPAQWAGSNTFQIILSAQDSSITFQYQNQSGFFDPAYATSTNPIVVGIENVTGTIGLTVSNNAYPTANTAVRFYYPDSVTLNVPDVEPTWVQNPENGGFFVSNGSTVTGQAQVENVGNTNVTSTTTVDLDILTSVMTSVFTEQEIIPPLNQGAGQTTQFANGFTTAAAGNYFYQVTTTNSSDINPSNDVQYAEMVVVDTAGPTATLSYYGGSAPTAGNTVNWSGGGGDDGVGVYYEPPFYPVEIVEVEAYVFVTGTLDSVGFEIRIYDDDSIPGEGTLLASVMVPDSQTVSNAWNVVSLPVPVEITSGGFYVGWYQTGSNPLTTTTVSLAQEANPPFSRRAFEILNDTWSSFRFNSTQETLIRVNIEKACKIAPGQLSLGGDTTVCDNTLPLVLDAGISGGTYSWSTGASSQTLSVNAAGTYYVDVLDPIGCSGTDTVSVTVIPSPTVDIGPDRTGCLGDTFVLASDQSFPSYQWSTGQTDSSIVVAFNNVYTLTVADSNGCFATDDASVTINLPPPVNLGPDEKGCFEEGGTVMLSTLLPGDYLWSTGDTTSSITLSQPDTVWLQITDVNGCVGADTIGVTDDTPTLDLGPDVTGCEGTPVLLDAGGGFASYVWSNGGTSQTTSVSMAGDYDLTVLNNTGCSAVDTITVILEPLPDPNFTSAGGWGVNWFKWEFNNTSIGATTFQWRFGDGTGTSTDENPSYNYAFAGQYDVTLVATNDCGSDSITITIEVTNTDGLEEQLFGPVAVYPSPNHGQFFIQFGEQALEETQVQLLDLRGQVVWARNFARVLPRQKTKVALDHPAPGLYLLQLESAGATVYRKVLVR